LLKTKPAEGIRNLSKFISESHKKSPEEQNKVIDQLNAAIEIVKKYNSSKYNAMEELRDDLLTLTVRQIQENAGTSRTADKLTKGFRLELAEQGLQGREVKRMNAFFKSIKERIDAGEPVDFDAEFKSFAAAQQEYLRSIDANNKIHPKDYAKDKNGKYPSEYPDGHSLVDSPSNRLITLFEKINKDSTKEKEAGYLEIAKLFYGKETGQVKTQKYLDKAMTSTYGVYQETELYKTKKAEMGNNSELAKVTTEGAKEMYKQYVEEKNKQITEENNAEPKPKPPIPLLDAKSPSGPIFDSFKAQIFQKRLDDEVKRQIRKSLTDKGGDTSNSLTSVNKLSTLELFNRSSPYDKENAKWYKPWSWKDYDEDNWEDFKVKSAEFALETLATLPIGMGAGAVGKLATRAALKLAFRGAEVALTETALTAFEQGGVRALLAEKSLSAVSRSRLLMAWGGGLAAEGSSMFAMNSAWEGLSTGHVSWAEGQDAGFWKFAQHFAESIAKAGAFRAIGASQGKILNAMKAETGSLQKVGATIIGEGFSGATATLMDAITMMAQGHGDQVTMDFVIKSMAQMALMSYGTHLAHGAVPLEHPGTAKETAKYEAVDKKVKAEGIAAKNKIIADNNKWLADNYAIGENYPDPIVKVTPGGEFRINGNSVNLKNFNFAIMPPKIREMLRTKITEAASAFNKTKKKSPPELPSQVRKEDILSSTPILKKPPVPKSSKIAQEVTDDQYIHPDSEDSSSEFDNYPIPLVSRASHEEPVFPLVQPKSPKESAPLPSALDASIIQSFTTPNGIPVSVREPLSSAPPPISGVRLKAVPSKPTIVPTSSKPHTELSSEHLTSIDEPQQSVAASTGKPKFEFTKEQLKPAVTKAEADKQLYADARRFIGNRSRKNSIEIEELIKAKNHQELRDTLEIDPRYRSLRKQRHNNQLIEALASDFNPNQKAVLGLFIESRDFHDTIEKVRALPPEIIDVMHNVPLEKDYLDHFLHKEYLQVPGTNRIYVSSSDPLKKLGGGGMGEVKRGTQIEKNANGEYVVVEVAIKRPHDTTLKHFYRELKGSLKLQTSRFTDRLHVASFSGLVKDGFGAEHPIIVSEVVKGLLEYNGKSNLVDVINIEKNPARVVGYLEQLAAGTETIHKNDFIPLDLKTEQAMLHPEKGVVFGDPDHLDAENLSNLEIISVTLKVTKDGKSEGAEIGNTVREGSRDSVIGAVRDTRTGEQAAATTPRYLEACKDHLQKAIDYAKSNPGKVPPRVKENPARGILGKIITEVIRDKRDILGATSEGKKHVRDLEILAQGLADPSLTAKTTIARARKRLAEIAAEYPTEVFEALLSPGQQAA
jgi:hypothetical protein